MLSRCGLQRVPSYSVPEASEDGLSAVPPVRCLATSGYWSDPKISLSVPHIRKNLFLIWGILLFSCSLRRHCHSFLTRFPTPSEYLGTSSQKSHHLSVSPQYLNQKSCLLEIQLRGSSGRHDTGIASLPAVRTSNQWLLTPRGGDPWLLHLHLAYRHLCCAFLLITPPSRSSGRPRQNFLHHFSILAVSSSSSLIRALTLPPNIVSSQAAPVTSLSPYSEDSF